MHTQFLLNFDDHMQQKSGFALLLADICSTKWDLLVYINMHILKLPIFALLMRTDQQCIAIYIGRRMRDGNSLDKNQLWY